MDTLQILYIIFDINEYRYNLDSYRYEYDM